MPWRALAALVLTACSGTALPDADAGSLSIAPPVAPVLTPCPPGWLERDGACEPSPSALACTGATFRLPGSTVCEPVDGPCPAGEWPTDLPGANVAYVRGGATGGDGSAGAPFGRIGDALAPDVLVAVAAGTYDEALVLPPGSEVRGVCAQRVFVVGAGAPAITVPAGVAASIASLSLAGDAEGAVVSGALALDGVAIVGAHGVALVVTGSAMAHRLLVRGTLPGAVARGEAVHVAGGGAASLVEVVIEASRDAAVIASGAGTRLEAADLAIRGTLGDETTGFGVALATLDAATLELERGAIEGAVTGGILLDGASATLRDVVVRDVTPDPMLSSAGILSRRSTLVLERVYVQRATGLGIALYGGTTTTGTDVIVERTLPIESHGQSIAILDGALTLERVEVRDVHYAGVLALGSAVVMLSDVRVHRVQEPGGIAQGLLAMDGAQLEVNRFALHDLSLIGAQAVGAGSRLVLSQGTIARIESSDAYDIVRGVEIDGEATAEISDVRIEDVRDVAVAAYGAGVSIRLLRTEVERVLERVCPTGCAGTGGGSGVIAVGGAEIEARELFVGGAALCGLQVAESGSLDVSTGRIHDNRIGACIQVPGFDVSRVVDGVEYRGNETNVDSGGVFVPPQGPVPTGL